MDLSPKQLADAHYAVSHLPEVARGLVAASLQAVVPGFANDLPDCTASFCASLRRVFEGGCMLDVAELRSLKKMGMATSGFLLRCRELALRWHSFEAGCNELLAVWNPPADLRTPTDQFSGRPGVRRLQYSALDWPIPQGIWLRDRLDALINGLQNVDCLAIHVIVPIVPDDRRLVYVMQMAEEFRIDAFPALEGDDGILKGLPRIQEEITRRIYQQDLNS